MAERSVASVLAVLYELGPDGKGWQPVTDTSWVELEVYHTPTDGTYRLIAWGPDGSEEVRLNINLNARCRYTAANACFHRLNDEQENYWAFGFPKSGHEQSVRAFQDLLMRVTESQPQKKSGVTLSKGAQSLARKMFQGGGGGGHKGHTRGKSAVPAAFTKSPTTTTTTTTTTSNSTSPSEPAPRKPSESKSRTRLPRKRPSIMQASGRKPGPPSHQRAKTMTAQLYNLDLGQVRNQGVKSSAQQGGKSPGTSGPRPPAGPPPRMPTNAPQEGSSRYGAHRNSPYKTTYLPMGALKRLPKKGDDAPSSDNSGAQDGDKKKMAISDPYNVQHLEHVEYNKKSRQYKNLPKQWTSTVVRQFGLDISQVERERVEGYNDRIPSILVFMRRYLTQHDGLVTEGIFRLAPDADDCAVHKKQLDRSEFTKCEDVNVIANLIKVWFRDMPVPLLQALSTEEIAECKTHDQAWHCLESLPEPQQSTFLWLVDLCVDVARNHEVNRMSPRNLSICISPNLFEPPKEWTDPMMCMMFSQKVAKLMHLCIEARQQGYKV